MKDCMDTVKKMTLEEKVSCLSGKTSWLTKPIERLTIESVRLCDGPVGLRKQMPNEKSEIEGETIPAVCFPASAGTAASFNREMLYELGETLGNECRGEGIDILLGPAVNIKRGPLCGRNFEYISEDPYLTAELAVAYTDGVQSCGVGVSLKHFAVNNQENRRMVISAEVDERALREIYLQAFEAVVKRSRPWTVMCAYNKVNGVYASENPWLLTQVLRDEWGFDGYVMSDWGAVSNRPEGVKAGLEMEMPSSFGVNDRSVLKAVQEGRLKEEYVDLAVSRLLQIHEKCVSHKKTPSGYDKEKDHAAARRFASESMVLLKNNGVLPLDGTKKIAIIGKMAETPRFQGGGSSHVKAHRVTGFLEALKAEYGHVKFQYAKAYENAEEPLNEELLTQALSAARWADTAIIFTGLPDSFESEGYDRSHIELPKPQNELISRICSVQKDTVVVLHNGSPVAMPWITKAAAVLEAYLGGEAVGEAEADLLFGRINPSAKLAETFPVSLDDCAFHPYFPGYQNTVEYRESIFVGYRYFDTAKKNVLFPFGYGLSYTTFGYSNLNIDRSRWEEKHEVEVTCRVTNTGERAGAEVLQLYVVSPKGRCFRPMQELKGFEKVFLKAGESKLVMFLLDARAFSCFNIQSGQFEVENGRYLIRVGASSRDTRLYTEVRLTACAITKSGKIDALEAGAEPKRFPAYDSCDLGNISDEEFELLLGHKLSSRFRKEEEEITIDCCLEDAAHTKWGKRIIKLVGRLLKKGVSLGDGGMGDSDITYYSVLQMPFHSFYGMAGVELSEEIIGWLVNLLNNRKVASSLFGLLRTMPGKIKQLN